MYKHVLNTPIRKFNFNLTDYMKSKLFLPSIICTKKCSTGVYSINLSPDDNDKVLQVINNMGIEQLPNYKLSKGRFLKIQSYRFKYGDFKSIQDVLNLDGMDMKSLEKFTKSILNPNVPSTSSRSEFIKKKSGKYTIPDISEVVRSSCNSCVSFHIGVSSVTWSRIQLNTNNLCELTHWQHLDLLDKKLHINDLVQRCLYLDYEIPDANCYILDNPQIAQATTPGNPEQVNINIQKSQLTAILSFALAKRFILPPKQTDCLNDDSSMELISNEESNIKNDNHSFNHNVFYMKRFIPGRLYNILVGSENVSTEMIISELLEKRIPIDNIDNIYISEILRQTYQNSERYQRDFLGRALLLGLTFLRLTIKKCPISIAKLTKKL